MELFMFSRETLKRAGWHEETPIHPFAIVSSRESDCNLGDGAYWPVRKYSWGICQAFHRKHSDCYWLKRLVLEEGFFELKQCTNARYNEYRVEQLRLRKPLHVKMWRKLVQLWQPTSPPLAQASRLNTELNDKEKTCRDA